MVGCYKACWLFLHLQTRHDQPAHALAVIGAYDTGMMKMDAPVKTRPVVLIRRMPE